MTELITIDALAYDFKTENWKPFYCYERQHEHTISYGCTEYVRPSVLPSGEIVWIIDKEE